MKVFLLSIISVAFLLLAVFLTYMLYRTWVSGRAPDYILFREGTVPQIMPSGAWNGSAGELGEVSWKGKKFLEDGKGINIFEKSGTQSQAYPFAFFEAEGRDAARVIRLDYNQKGNPLWLRFIVDEMVSVGDNKFLGLVYLNIIPGFPFRMGYFRLEK